MMPFGRSTKKAACSMAATSTNSNPSRAFFVRNLQSLVEIILLDHAYSKPWSAHPEAGKARPVKTLFLPKSEDFEDISPEEDMLIDVCDPVASPPSVIVYDMTKARTVMSECERHVTAVSSKRTPDTWEEQISRDDWTPKQNSLFDKVLKVLSTLRLARLAYEQTNNEPVKRRIATDKATKRFRQILSNIEWDPQLTSWLHSTLVDGLSIPLLACYLDVLQTLRAKAPTLVDRMIATPVSQRRGLAANPEALSLLLKRPWDPSHGLVTQHKSRKLPGSPLMLIVPSGPTTSAGSGTSSKRTRFWHNQLSVLGKVVPVTMHTSNGGSGVSITQCLDHIIGAVRTKVLELRSHFPNRPIVLIGWSIGALVSCQVALMESVCAVVCLGFPLTGLDGVRGDIEDPLLELKAPTLFVIGSNSCLNTQEDIEEVRERIKAETSLLVVGGADEQLRLTRAKKKQEGLTQNMVDRLIMDQIGEFLGNVLTSVNNNQQQRNDLSDADDNDVKRKKRKRSISRDLSSEMSHQSKTHANTHYLKKSPKGENQKTMLKIPVGGTLGALSSVRNLSQPSPAKRPRPSRSKANKINPASTTAGLIRVPGSLPGSIATVSGAPQLAQAIASQALVKGVNAGASSTPRSITLPNTSVGLVPQVHPTGQGFVSLAAKGAVKSEGGSQSYVAVSGTGSPSIVTTGTGSIQYVIKPVIKPQSHRYLPMPISVSPGTQSSQMATSSQATVISTASGGIRYTSLTQSPTSPFTSILNLKGNTTSTPGTPITIGASGSLTGLAGGSLVRPSASIMSTVQGRRIVPGSMVTSSDGKTYLTTLPQHVTGVSQARMSPTSIVRTVSGSLSTSQAAAGGSQVQISGQKVFVTQAAASTGLVFSSGKPAQSVVTTRLLSGQVPSSGLMTSSVASQLQTKTNTVRTISRPSTATTVSMVRTLPGHLPGNVQFTMAKPGSPAQVSVPATVIAQIANSAKALAAQANAARSTAGQVPPSVQIGGRLSQSQTVNQRTGQVPASIQLTSPSTQGRTVSLNLPIRVAVTQGNVINRAPTSTLTTRTTTQLTAPVTQLLQGASTSAASTRPQLVVSRSGVLPHSVMIKGGSAVNMQSVLAGLPPGTRVIATTTADGNVLVVGPMHPTTTTRSKVETTSPAVAVTTAQSSSVSKADRVSDASSKSVAGSATQQAQATPATPTTTAESSNK